MSRESDRPVIRWGVTVLAAVLVGLMLGTNSVACDPNARVTLWDKIQVLIMFWIFIDVGWQWSRYVLTKGLRD